MIKTTIYSDSPAIKLLRELSQKMGDDYKTYNSIPSEEGEETWYIKVPNQDLGFFAWGNSADHFSPIRELKEKCEVLEITITQ